MQTSYRTFLTFPGTVQNSTALVSVTGTNTNNFPFMLDPYQIPSSKQEVSTTGAINSCFRKKLKFISFHFSLSLIYLRVLRISFHGALPILILVITCLLENTTPTTVPTQTLFSPLSPSLYAVFPK